MRRIPSGLALIAAIMLAVFGGMALATGDKYAVQVPGGLALAECRGYEDWPAVAVSHPQEPENDTKLNLIVANPAMIEAYKAGIPGNGKAFPDGSRIVKLLYKPKASEQAPFAVLVPDSLAQVGCMVKDSKRFADTGGWGYAQFDYDSASDSFAPNTSVQENDAKCGASCHQIAEKTDFVFTAYGKR